MTHADDFPIAIRRTKNGFIAEAAALGLSRSGQDVTALEADMRAAVSDILAACRRHGAKIETVRNGGAPPPAPNPYRGSIVGAAAAVLVVAIVSLPTFLLYQKVTSVVSSAGQFSAFNVEKLLSSGVKKTADTLELITPERRDQLTHDFSRIARALEPYAAQLRPLLVAAPAPSPQPPGDRRP
jgi:hypothetical protein